jgi:16S rRNA C967 or C1407 C5-methylase (RsmB/RsmF family)
LESCAHPDGKWRKSPHNRELKKNQWEIVNIAARYVRPGGIMVYSTCTLESGRKRMMIEKFLRNSRAMVSRFEIHFRIAFSVSLSYHRIRDLRHFLTGILWTVSLVRVSEKRVIYFWVILMDL